MLDNILNIIIQYLIVIFLLIDYFILIFYFFFSDPEKCWLCGMYENYLKKKISRIIFEDIKRYCLKQCDIHENIYYIYLCFYIKNDKSEWLYRFIY